MFERKAKGMNFESLPGPSGPVGTQGTQGLMGFTGLQGLTQTEVLELMRAYLKPGSFKT
jgi:hypothetical protein